MKKSTLISALLSIVLLASCNPSPGCVVQGGVDLFLAPAIAVGLECSNEPAVLAFLQDAGNKAGLCKAQPSPSPAPAQALSVVINGGGILSELCTALGNAVVGQLAGAIPADWGCKASAAQNGLKGVVGVACGMIPAAQKAAQAQ